MAKTEKQELKKSRVPYMILSLIIAIIIWTLVAFINDPDIAKTIHYVKVIYTGQQALKDKGYIALGVPDELDLSVKLSGTRNNLVECIGKVKIEVDVSELDGAGEYELEGTVKTYNQQVGVVKKSFSYITVTVEEYEEKEIPIEVHQIGSFKNDPVLSEPEFRTIKIGGAKSEIDMVEEGYVTVDLSKLTASEETTSGVVLTDKDGKVITDAETIEGPTASMKITNTVCEYAELEVKPILDSSLALLYELDEANTAAEPSSVRICVLPGHSFSEIKAVIREHTTDEIQCELIREEGMYIPDDTTVTVTPAFIEPEVPEENNE